ncbi:hypothetical protein [uncultured Paraglaciecola sp.]|uniref:hypothetical protein n=1 Tax=uncultured Paraglaciecola sp. TaxID=1765024 RepID=UPI00260599CF|nr:hypothetical protein [uncultured Paraglaciecola sp.]
MPNIAFLMLFSIGLLLSACATEKPPIMTDEKFDSRVTSQGKTEFVYGISWHNTSRESLLRDGRAEIKSANSLPRLSQHRPNKLTLQADNQTKLELEDQAAQALKLRLAKEQLCQNSYEISDVIWKDDNIRLLGYCL